LVHTWQDPEEETAVCGGSVPSQSWILASAGQCAELRVLARSSDREEADRARAILLPLEGWTSERIAAAFGVCPDSVRHWRWIFGRKGGAGLRARKAAGPAAAKEQAALSVIEQVLAPEIERRSGERISKSRLSVVLKKGASPGGGPGAHPYLAHVWAKRGEDLRVEAPGRSHKRAMLGVLDCAAHRLLVNTSTTKRRGDFIALLGRLDALYGPCPGRPQKPVILVLDNGPIHTSKASQAALAARPWLTVEWLPKYAPELNDIERSWRDLKRHFLAHQTFSDPDHLDRAIHRAIADMNRERQTRVCTNLRNAT
jgi:transposase